MAAVARFIAAGLVAQQIRSGINKLLVEVEKRHLAEHLFGQQISMEIAERCWRIMVVVRWHKPVGVYKLA